jgi:DUF4097 and DUF4098 domain-containing protein YvlB
MKRTILFLILLLLNAPVFAQSTNTEEVVIPLTKPGERGNLEVSLVSGSIKVTGTKTKEVLIRVTAVERTAKAAHSQTPDGLKRIANTSLGITATEQNNKVSVTTEFINRPMNLEIQVPQNFSLKLATVNGGNIEISNLNGDFELSNVNGHIAMENVSGSAVANTTNGHIKANFLKWDGSSPMAFTTLNGNVDLTLPASSKFNTKLRSDRGEVYTDFDLAHDPKQTQAKPAARSESGLYQVSTADFITGKVNGGGPEILIKNMHGNIYIRKSK